MDLAGIDLPGLVRALDRYPYGCAEQITSRALPDFAEVVTTNLISNLGSPLPGLTEVLDGFEDPLLYVRDRPDGRGGPRATCRSPSQ